MDKESNKRHYLSSDVFGVIGVCGVVGNMVVRVLSDNGFKVAGTDSKAEGECNFKYTLNNYSIPLYLGGHPEIFYNTSDYIITPPSLPVESILHKELKDRTFKDEFQLIEVEDILRFIKPGKPVLCVTGTNGKTTTVSILKHICRYSGLKPAEHGFKDLQGNIEYIPPLQCRLNGDVAVLETGTFGNPGDLGFVIERSQPDCGIITNITPDHMHDDHDFLKYARIKGEFVDYLKDKKLIVNGDDPTLWGLIESKIPDYKDKDIITFGVESSEELSHNKSVVNNKLCWCGREIPVMESISGMGDYKCPCGLEKPAIHYRATNIKENSFTLHAKQKVKEVMNPLIGLHNIYNILGAIAAAFEFFNIPLEEIISNIESFTGVPGRLDYIGEYQGKTIIVDYAHNPDGVGTVLRELKKIYKTIAVVITVSSESGERGNMAILNKSLDNADYVIPASYYSRKVADNLIKKGKSVTDKIILTSTYPDKFKKGTLGANLEQIKQGLEAALKYDVQTVVCIGEAALKFREEIRKIVVSP